MSGARNICWGLTEVTPSENGTRGLAVIRPPTSMSNTAMSRAFAPAMPGRTTFSCTRSSPTIVETRWYVTFLFLMTMAPPSESLKSIFWPVSAAKTPWMTRTCWSMEESTARGGPTRAHLHHLQKRRLPTPRSVEVDKLGDELVAAGGVEGAGGEVLGTGGGLDVDAGGAGGGAPPPRR